jgi:hypothetical protein
MAKSAIDRALARYAKLQKQKKPRRVTGKSKKVGLVNYVRRV